MHWAYLKLSFSISIKPHRNIFQWLYPDQSDELIKVAGNLVSDANDLWSAIPVFFTVLAQLTMSRPKTGKIFVHGPLYICFALHVLYKA